MSRSPRPLDDRDLDRLEALLDAVPAPLEPLDVGLLDGFLCGVLLQPKPVPAAAWLPYVTDIDGRALPAGHDTAPLHALVRRRHAELDAAIDGRRWFDPWVFELAVEDGEADGAADPDDADEPAPVEATYPWAAGFATALDLFPDLMAHDPARILGPLALVYRHLGADDLEDADALLAEIETLEPAASLDEAVEDLVQATLLLADVTRPREAPAAPRRTPLRRPLRR